ncbi:MAG: DUF362 domain-containing protein [Deltaproteobacteria bacterium]|nr:DUF362 domain-containing protein [Deltaproteobacteria bacterium]
MDCSRRQFLQTGIALGGGLAIGSGILDATMARAAASAPASRVAVVRRKGVTGKDGGVRADVVKRMVFDAVCRATGLDSPRDAFGSLFSASDVVGIKVSCLAGKRMSTRPEVALALAEGVQLAGVKPFNVIVWERSSRELERAGYQIQRESRDLRIMGSDGDYESQPTDAGSVGGCFTRIVTRLCTRQISAPVLKDHDLSGVSLGMKNWYGAIHNPNKYHDNNCSPYVADLFGKSVLRERVRLVVCDALFAQCHGGPAYAPDFMWRFEGVIASLDPVAHDAVGARIIEDERRRRGLPALLEDRRPPRWLERAAALGLGTADRQQIKLIEG